MPENQLASTAIRAISSMATRQVLAELVATFEQRYGVPVVVESVGGVDAARRIDAGEAFDLAILASDTIDRLVRNGRLLPGSRVDLVHSGVAVAVRSGAAQPDISTEPAMRHAVLSAKSIGYSTGPSGVALIGLFERWGIAGQIQDRLFQAPAGVPVGSLVARGEVELGFQQLSELIHIAGIDVVGPLPAAVQITTTFSAGVCVNSQQADQVRDLIAFLNSADAAPVKRRQGMEPAFPLT